jgi:hypothetical protein
VAAAGLGIPDGHYQHPTGERADWSQLWLYPWPSRN